MRRNQNNDLFSSWGWTAIKLPTLEQMCADQSETQWSHVWIIKVWLHGDLWSK